MPNLYLIISPEEYLDYDTYDSAVVCANSEAEAKCIHPNGDYIFINERFVSKQSKYVEPSGHFCGWVHPKDVQVTFVGVAAKGMQPGAVVCASFLAG